MPLEEGGIGVALFEAFYEVVGVFGEELGVFPGDDGV